MTSDKGLPALAVDTIEIGRKAFEVHQDAIRAMGLAVVWLGLDAHVKYVLGDDARVKFGPRQAFGNKSMKIKLNKQGITTLGGSYTFKFDTATGLYEGEPFVLMQNWQV